MGQAVSADRIDALLPQTQCRKCGYAGCRPYAEAIAAGTAPIDRCPPGGAAGIARLAALLERPIVPLDPACGSEAPLRVAAIDPASCIGCTLCIQACPVSAIVGAIRRMHVVVDDECTGCELCVAPCPVDCIAMVAVDRGRTWSDDDAAAARSRHRARELRRLSGRPDGASAGGATEPRIVSRPLADAEARKQAVVAAALARARQRQAGGAAR